MNDAEAFLNLRHELPHWHCRAIMWWNPKFTSNLLRIWA